MGYYIPINHSLYVLYTWLFLFAKNRKVAKEIYNHKIGFEGHGIKILPTNFPLTRPYIPRGHTTLRPYQVSHVLLSSSSDP